MKIEGNNRGALWGSLACLGISLLIWVKYLFFYDPHHGVLILLATVPVGLIGIIPTMYIKMVPLKISLVVVHLASCCPLSYGGYWVRRKKGRHGTRSLHVGRKCIRFQNIFNFQKCYI